MQLVAVITPRTEPEMYQRATIEAKAIRPVESVEKIFSTAASIALAVAGCTCGRSAGNTVPFQTWRWPTAPSTASPRSVSGTSAFSTANEIELARSSSSCSLKRSIQSLTKRVARARMRPAYPKTAAARLAPVFDTLSDRLQSALGDLRKQGRLDEESISRAMREVRLALLEADVNFEV